MRFDTARLDAGLVALLFITIACAPRPVRAQTSQPPTANGTTPAAAEPDLINPDRPGIADGSTVIGPRRFQLEIGYQNEFRKNSTGTQRAQFVPTLMRFGIDKRWEARIEGNTYTTTHTTALGAATVDTAGMAPLSFGFKYHFQDQPAVGKRPSLGVIFRLFPASGSSDFKTNHTTADLRLAADWDFTPNLSLNPNVGIGVYEDNSGQAFTTGLAAVTLNYFNKARNINPFVDMGFQAPEQRNGRSSLIVDAGVAYIIGSNWQVDVSAGTAVAGRTGPHLFLAGGVSIRF